MSDPTNSGFVDKWTLVHALNGMAIGLLGTRPLLALSGAVAYELVEYAHEWPRGSTLFGSKEPETPVNIAGDLTIYTLMYYAARSMKHERYAPLLGVATLGAAAALGLKFAPMRTPSKTGS
jgi:hypothetical protein